MEDHRLMIVFSIDDQQQIEIEALIFHSIKALPRMTRIICENSAGSND